MATTTAPTTSKIAPGVRQLVPGPFGPLARSRRDPLGFTLDCHRRFGDVFHFRFGPFLFHVVAHPARPARPARPAEELPAELGLRPDEGRPRRGAGDDRGRALASPAPARPAGVPPSPDRRPGRHDDPRDRRHARRLARAGGVRHADRRRRRIRPPDPPDRRPGAREHRPRRRHRPDRRGRHRVARLPRFLDQQPGPRPLLRPDPATLPAARIKTFDRVIVGILAARRREPEPRPRRPALDAPGRARRGDRHRPDRSRAARPDRHLHRRRSRDDRRLSGLDILPAGPASRGRRAAPRRGRRRARRSSPRPTTCRIWTTPAA